MRAIFIGRFQPFHKGHLKAIKWILKKEKKISIVIGSLEKFLVKENPFSFQERKEMIKRTLLAEDIKNFEIYGVPDFFDDVFWAKKVLEITKSKKNEVVVFSQNPWTKRCFQKIGTKIQNHPIYFNGLSATKIRERMAENKKWENLVPKLVLDFLKKNKAEKKIKFLSILPEKKIVDFLEKKIKEAKAKGAIVGVSGGIDSSVTAFLVKKTLGKKAFFLNILFIRTCPLQDNVSLLEKKIKTKIKRIFLDEIYKSFLKILPQGDKLTKGNLKSRLRMALLYYFANLNKLLVVGTSNKSELEIGYFTKFGDGGADILPLGDLYKTEVVEMVKRLKLPKKIIETVPSANLWPGQTDEKEIGLDYQKLDIVLKLLAQNFKEKEISFLTGISQKKIKDIIERKKENFHKLSFPPICRMKSF